MDTTYIQTTWQLRLSIFIYVDILVLVSEFIVVVGAEHCGHIHEYKYYDFISLP